MCMTAYAVGLTKRIVVGYMDEARRITDWDARYAPGTLRALGGPAKRLAYQTHAKDGPLVRPGAAAFELQWRPRCRSLGKMLMTRYSFSCATLAGLVLLGACAQTPMGPTIQVMPGPGKSFANFQNDQAICRQFADEAVRDQAQGANLRGLGTAALTTVLGAGLGAAIGGGQGAAIGAASGALGGAGLGAFQSSNAQNSIQAQFDNAFAQCMFSLGNTVPATGPMMVQPSAPRS